MNVLLSDLSDWHHVYQFSKELIDPNTYAKKYLSSGTAYWILTRGGYLVISTGVAYPVVGMALLVPVIGFTLLKKTGRAIIKTTASSLFYLTVGSAQKIRKSYYWYSRKK